MADVSILQLPAITQVDLNDFTIVESLLENKTTKARVSQLLRVTSVNGEIGDVILDADNIDDAATINKFVTQAEKTKLAYIRDDLSNNVYLNGTGNYSAITLTGVAAADVTYDNTISQLGSTNVQGAIDELDNRIDEVENPTIDAYIGTNKSVVHSYSAVSSTVEVGTNITATLTAIFNRGIIKNGDGSTGPSLVGDPNTYTFSGPNMSALTIPSTDTTVITSASSYEIALESVNWNVIVDYDIGTGTYTDSKGDVATNLDAQRVAGSINDNTNNVSGRYYGFYGIGILAATSAEVRSLNKKFLSSSNTGTFTIFVPQGEKQISFSIPSGKTAKALLRESSNADVTSSFTINTFNVDDAAPNPVSYDTYTSQLAGTGYTNDVNYDITIT